MRLACEIASMPIAVQYHINLSKRGWGRKERQEKIGGKICSILAITSYNNTHTHTLSLSLSLSLSLLITLCLFLPLSLSLIECSSPVYSSSALRLYFAEAVTGTESAGARSIPSILSSTSEYKSRRSCRFSSDVSQ